MSLTCGKNDTSMHYGKQKASTWETWVLAFMWVLIFWHTTPQTLLHIMAQQWSSINDSGHYSLSSILHPVTLNKLLSNGLKNKIKRLKTVLQNWSFPRFKLQIYKNGAVLEKKIFMHSMNTVHKLCIDFFFFLLMFDVSVSQTRRLYSFKLTNPLVIQTYIPQSCDHICFL